MRQLQMKYLFSNNHNFLKFIIYMENRPRTTIKLDQNRRSTNPKFKQVKNEYNQLQSKYDIYKNGTPNVYEQNIDNLKVYHLKHDIKTLSLPAIDYLLQEMKNIPENMGTNHRNFVTHPTMLQKYGNKFRNLISDQQEIRDFLDWFRKKQTEISNRNCKANQKFYLNQSLIASGFNQILIQIGAISKSRSELLRMLWNKQNTEVEQVINFMHKESSDFEKKNLEAVKSLHLGYQEQIISLRNDNYCACKKLEQAVVLNQGCINSLRTMRKQIKKYEKIIKQLNQANYFLKMESIQVLEQNINLIMKQKNIPFDKARVLSYQALQLGKMRKDINRNKKAKNLFIDVKNKAEFLIDNNQVPDLEYKKEKLVKFIINRMKQNPSEKACVMKGELSDEDDEQIKLQQTIQQMLHCKELRAELQCKAPKKNNFFENKSTMTENYETIHVKSEQNYDSVGVQTACTFHEQPKASVINVPQIEQAEGIMILQKKKIQKRHSLILLQMDKMMEFKKLDRGSRPMRITPIINSTQINNINNKTSRFNSEVEDDSPNRNDSSSQSVSEKDEEAEFKKQESADSGEMKKRQINIRRRHNQSLLMGKSSEFHQLLQKIAQQNSSRTPQSEDVNIIQPKLEKVQSGIQTRKVHSIAEKANDIKELVGKYMKKKSQQKQSAANPEKQLKKILTDTFKNIYISKKTNFLNQMLRTAKNSYGKIIYENKLIHLISMIIESKQKCLLGALNILLGISDTGENYDKIRYEDINDLYFKTYFYLCSKTPIQNQFNIWGNYTTLQKMNSPGFTSILQNYFSESKCMYLKLKIREFIGVGAIEQIQNNYYVQINPLMLYILEVYLLEKQNYYESYSPIINFLTEESYLDLETFVFLLDLLCFKQEEQKELINTYFNSKKQEENLFCEKDLFYRICVKYELPLFEFIKILKLQQFKKLHQCFQAEYTDISDLDKWNKVRQNIQKILIMKGTYTGNMQKIINKLNNYIKSSPTILSQPFLFFYRIVIYTAYSCQ